MDAADKRLTEKIDGNRGGLSRNEFIQRCIEEVERREFELERLHNIDFNAGHETQAMYATREELQDFKRSIGGLLKNFMEFYIAADLELSASRAVGDEGELNYTGNAERAFC